MDFMLTTLSHMMSYMTPFYLMRYNKVLR